MQGQGISKIVGGDLGTQLNAGHRLALLPDLVDNFDPVITNDDVRHTQDMETWLFESVCGTRKHIDFIFCSQGLHLVSAHATFALDLGSNNFFLDGDEFGKQCLFDARNDGNLHWINTVCLTHTMLFRRKNSMLNNPQHPTTVTALQDVLSQSVRSTRSNSNGFNIVNANTRVA